jgi:hypothetical protein
MHRKNRVMLTALLVFILIVCIWLAMAPQAKAAANIRVSTLGKVIDPRFGSGGVLGVVKNVGDKPAANITIYVKFFDATGNFINSTVTIAGEWPFIENNFVLMPNQSATFSAFLPTEIGGSQVDHATTRITYVETSNFPPLGLQTSIISDSTNNDGNNSAVNIRAKVTNHGATTADEFYFWVVAYNENGAPVGGTNYWNSLELPSGSSREFNLDFTTLGIPSSYTYYSESATLSYNATGSFILTPQYRAQPQDRQLTTPNPTPETPTPTTEETQVASPSPQIPEFPLWFLIPLLVTASTIAGVTVLSRKMLTH